MGYSSMVGVGWSRIERGSKGRSLSLVQDGKSCWVKGEALVGDMGAKPPARRETLSADLPEAAEFAKQIRRSPTYPHQNLAKARVASLALSHTPSWATP
ncbi:MAG: hypothetical protein R3Y56_09385 [Akkermansia sp.]